MLKVLQIAQAEVGTRERNFSLEATDRSPADYPQGAAKKLRTD